MFASVDDFGLITEIPNTYVRSLRVNIALARIEEWAELHKLSFSAEKIVRKSGRLDRMKNSATPPRIHVLSLLVKSSHSARYFYVTMHEKFNAMTHVEYI